MWERTIQTTVITVSGYRIKWTLPNLQNKSFWDLNTTNNKYKRNTDLPQYIFRLCQKSDNDKEPINIQKFLRTIRFCKLNLNDFSRHDIIAILIFKTKHIIILINLIFSLLFSQESSLFIVIEHTHGMIFLNSEIDV